MFHYYVKIGIFVALVASSGKTMAEEDFAQITGDFGATTAVEVGATCTGAFQIPNTMWTIRPTNGVEIFTSPPNLLTVTSSNSVLSFQWNEDVAKSASSGGVRIGLPAAQLETVKVHSATRAQILDGFEGVATIKNSGASELTAVFSSSSAQSIKLTVSGAATANIQSNVNISRGSISGASSTNIKTPTYENIDVSGASTLSIDGAIAGGRVSGASTVTASGAVTASLDASGASGVYSTDCNLVTTSGASSCKTGTYSVNVDTTEKPITMSGTGRCWGWGAFGWGSSCSSLYSSINLWIVGLITIVPVLYNFA